MKQFQIDEVTQNDAVNLALDALKKERQAIVFANSKDSAEKTAEEIAKKFDAASARLDEISLEALHALSRPTKQCERLALCLKNGIAFHHAGLTRAQRELVEKSFKKREIKIICSTPTLAAGLDLPAFMTIIKSLKRFGREGMSYIPVLEYLQMAGRAGRPRYDKEGQAIAIASSKKEAEFIRKHYIEGLPEDIYSKLGVEPVLRTYVLSLVASGFASTGKEVLDFFGKSFYAHQYRDPKRISKFIGQTLLLLKEWEFLEGEQDFITADGNEELKATILGKRVAELYIDPLTAHNFITGMRKSRERKINEFSFLQLISASVEMRPLLRARIKEHDIIQEKIAEISGFLLVDEPSMYDIEYEEFMDSIKTSMFFSEWIDEKDEEYMFEKYKVRPGEIRMKLETADWLIYAIQEISRLIRMQHLYSEAAKIRIRLKYGVREELIPLLQLKNIGRVRARKLFSHGIKDIGGVKNAELRRLSELIGEGIARDVKSQVGEKMPEDQKVKEGKKKGQINLDDFSME